MLWFGARLVVENKLSPGELSTFVIYAVYVGSNVGQLAGVVSSLVQVYHHALTLCPALPRPCHIFQKQSLILYQRLPIGLLTSMLLNGVLFVAKPKNTGCSGE